MCERLLLTIYSRPSPLKDSMSSWTLTNWKKGELIDKSLERAIESNAIRIPEAMQTQLGVLERLVKY